MMGLITCRIVAIGLFDTMHFRLMSLLIEIDVIWFRLVGLYMVLRILVSNYF